MSEFEAVNEAMRLAKQQNDTLREALAKRSQAATAEPDKPAAFEASWRAASPNWPALMMLEAGSGDCGTGVQV